MQFHEIYLFDFSSFFAWTFLNFLAVAAMQAVRLYIYQKVYIQNYFIIFSFNFTKNLKSLQRKEREAFVVPRITYYIHSI